MDDSIDKLLRELESFGRDNDASVASRAERMLNITRDTGELLGVLVTAMAARSVLEIGTSNGYSTVWLARAAARLGGRVRTVEIAEHKVALAAQTFRRAGLENVVEQVVGDAGKALRDTADASVDLLFLDSDRDHYVAWWADLRRVLRPGGLLVVDNAISHQAEIAPLASLIDADPRADKVLVPIGNGELLATLR